MSANEQETQAKISEAADLVENTTTASEIKAVPQPHHENGTFTSARGGDPAHDAAHDAAHEAAQAAHQTALQAALTDPASTQSETEATPDEPMEPTAVIVLEGKSDPDPDLFAYVPDKDHPSTWKLPIPDLAHVADAITAIGPGLRGQKASIPKSDMPDVMTALKKRIMTLTADGSDERKHLMARLSDPDNDGDNDLSKTGDTDHDYMGAGKAFEFDDGFYDTAVKSISEDGWRVGGYGIVFTDAQAKDTTGDYFTAKSELQLEDWPIKPVLYHHALDASVKTTPVGKVDKTTVDDIGVWVEAQLDKRNRYASAIREMARKGTLGWSSGALPQGVKRARDGYLEKWPVIEFSLTPTPAMPEVTTVAAKTFFETNPAYEANLQMTLRAYKALNIPTDGLIPRDETVTVAKDTPQPIKTANAAQTVTPVSPNDTPSEVIEMTDITPAQLSDMIAAAVKAAQTPAPVAEPEVVVKPPTKSLEAAPIPALPIKSANRVEVVGERRYAELSAADMSFMAEVMGAVARDPMQANSNGAYVARQFLQTLRNDEDGKFGREMAAKAFRENNQRRLPDSALAYLPYKSLGDVEANNYQPVEVKANELDNTSISTQGPDWVPTIWSQDLWQRVRISNPVASNISTLQMPALTYNVPVQSTDPTVYFTGEAANATDLAFQGATLAVTQIKTNKAQLVAKKLTSRVAMSTEFSEDSIIPALPDVRAQTVRAMMNYIDDTIINGDIVTSANTNVNLIDGTPASAPNAPAYLALDGFRKYALVTNTAQSLSFGGGSPTLALIRQLQFSLAPQYAVDIGNLVGIIDPATYAKMLGMPEFATWQNVGTSASNILGTLPGGVANTVDQAAYPVGVINGIRFYVSAQLGKSQSTGKISATPANNTLGSIVIYHMSRWKLGYRRQVQVDTFSSPFLSDTIQLMVSARIGLASFDTTSAAVGYNILV